MTDLPLSGRIVQLLVIARRFRCDAVLCGRQIFTERFAEGVLAPSARRTARLDSIVHHLGLALGGRPAAGFAKRLMLPPPQGGVGGLLGGGLGELLEQVVPVRR